jgi:hypothetical protein
LRISSSFLETSDALRSRFSSCKSRTDPGADGETSAPRAVILKDNGSKSNENQTLELAKRARQQQQQQQQQKLDPK